MNDQTLFKIELFTLLCDHFSMGELRIICLKLGIDFEEIVGEEKSVKAVSLIEFLGRRDRLHELETQIRQQRSPLPPVQLPANKPLYKLSVSYVPADRAWVEGYLLDGLASAEVVFYGQSMTEMDGLFPTSLPMALRCSERHLLIVSEAALPAILALLPFFTELYGENPQSWPVLLLSLSETPLPRELRGLPMSDATSAEARTKVLEELCHRLGYPSPCASAALSAPYPGMKAFTEQESTEFPYYGREREIEALRATLQRERFVAVVGRSGSGKSSLVLAGLIPALRQMDKAQEGKWAICQVRPDEQPLRTLAAALTGGEEVARQPRSDEQLRQPVAELPDEETALRPKVEALLAREGANRLLLVIDQAESLFLPSMEEVAGVKDEMRRFQKLILEFLELPDCYVVMTLREDARDYAKRNEQPLHREITHHQFPLNALTPEGLREAIVRPAADKGVLLEETLIERLVDEVHRSNEPGLLPFLQVTLRYLWQKRERRYLSLHAYESIVLAAPTPGNGASGVKGLTHAVMSYADSALKELKDKGREPIARRILVQLVQFNKEGKYSKRQQPIVALRDHRETSEEFDLTLAYLKDARLIVSGESGQGEESIDLVHEVLITAWQYLQTQIQIAEKDELKRRHFEGYVAERNRLREDGGGLLDGAKIREVERWLERANEHGLTVGQALMDLLHESKEKLAPSSNRLGEFVLVGGIATLLGGIALLFQYVLRIPIIRNIQLTLWLLLASLAMIVGLVYLLSRRADPYILPRLTQRIAENRPLMSAILALFLGMVMLWVNVGQEWARQEAACIAQGFTRNSPGVPRIAVTQDGTIQSLEVELFAGWLAIDSEGYLQVWNTNPVELENCRSFFDIHIALEGNPSIAEPQDNVTYRATVRYSNSFIKPFPYQVGGNRSCGLFLELAHKIIPSIIGFSPVDISDDSALLSSPKDCAPYQANQEGYRLLKKGHYEEAEKYFLRAITLFPDYAIAHHNLGSVYNYTARPVRAREVISDAITLAAQPYPLFLVSYGNACYDEGAYQCAVDSYKEAIEHHPNRIIAWLNLANAYRKQGEYTLAGEALKDAALFIEEERNEGQKRYYWHLFYRAQGLLAYEREPQALADAQGWFASAKAIEPAESLFASEISFYQALIAQVLEPEKRCDYLRDYKENQIFSTPYRERERQAIVAAQWQELNCPE